MSEPCVLVAYVSKNGGTAEIARWIAETLTDAEGTEQNGRASATDRAPRSPRRRGRRGQHGELRSDHARAAHERAARHRLARGHPPEPDPAAAPALV